MRREQVALCRALKDELTEAKRKIKSLDAVLLMLDANYKPEAGRTTAVARPETVCLTSR